MSKRQNKNCSINIFFNFIHTNENYEQDYLLSPTTTGKPIPTQSTSIALTNTSISSTSSTHTTTTLLSTTPATTVTVSSLIDKEGMFVFMRLH